MGDRADGLAARPLSPPAFGLVRGACELQQARAWDAAMPAAGCTGDCALVCWCGHMPAPAPLPHPTPTASTKPQMPSHPRSLSTPPARPLAAPPLADAGAAGAPSVSMGCCSCCSLGGATWPVRPLVSATATCRPGICGGDTEVQ